MFDASSRERSEVRKGCGEEMGVRLGCRLEGVVRVVEGVASRSMERAESSERGKP